MSNINLSIVVPIYNEDSGILELYDRLNKILKVNNITYEILLVDDGSKDNSWNIIRNICEIHKCIIGIKLSRNFGHQLAISAGLSSIRGDRALIIDADLQDPPELINQMLILMDQGYDVVYGKRLQRQGESYFKKLSAKMFYRLLNRLIDIDIPTDTGDFRMMSKRAVCLLNKMPEQHRFIRGMVSWIGLKQTPIYYNREPRFSGETKYPLTKMLKFAFDAITGFSIQPLRLASYIGLIFAFFAFGLGFYSMISYFKGNNVEGWTSIIILMLIIGSAQFFVIGLIGEYLGRIYQESKKRPLYIIEEIIKYE